MDEETGPVFAERSPVVTDAPNIPAPPFWGVRVQKDYDLREIFQYINDTALFKNQWQLKTASQEDYARLVEEKYRPIKKKLEEDVLASGLFEPKVVYGYFPAQGEGNDVIVYEPWRTGMPVRAERSSAQPRGDLQPRGLPRENSFASPFPAKERAANSASRTSSLQNRPARWM